MMHAVKSCHQAHKKFQVTSQGQVAPAASSAPRLHRVISWQAAAAATGSRTGPAAAQHSLEVLRMEPSAHPASCVHRQVICCISLSCSDLYRSRAAHTWLRLWHTCMSVGGMTRSAWGSATPMHTVAAPSMMRLPSAACAPADVAADPSVARNDDREAW